MSPPLSPRADLDFVLADSRPRHKPCCTDNPTIGRLLARLWEQFCNAVVADKASSAVYSRIDQELARREPWRLDHLDRLGVEDWRDHLPDAHADVTKSSAGLVRAADTLSPYGY